MPRSAPAATSQEIPTARRKGAYSEPATYAGAKRFAAMEARCRAINALTASRTISAAPMSRLQRYVEGLENRLEKMEKLLTKIYPDGDFRQELDNDRPIWQRHMDIPSPGISSPSALHIHGIKTATEDDDGLAPACGPPDSDDEEEADYATVDISANLRERLQQDPMNYRFFGKSSGVMLIQAALDLKNEYTGNSIERPTSPAIGQKRPEFWNVRPWELATVNTDIPIYEFPEADLLADLIDLYFEYTNLVVPLLHRPTFEKGILDNLHYRSSGFGATVLLVCAIASRYSSDLRVFLPNANSLHTAGWKYFDQVQMVRKSLLAPPCLYDLQVYVLSVLFLQSSSAPQACWTMVGIGVRMAQDVGAHRRKMYTSNITADDELWKRAFWGLVLLDRFLSSILGRPCALQDEDFDLDFPVDCDDEYWDHPDPALAFKQPPGKPSKITFFIIYLKLLQVLAFALRTIYSINKSKIMLGFVGPKWEQHIVAELDSALNKWIDSVPDHLRWDPHREDMEFFNQSAYLHVTYYHLQILIHRPFIPSPRKPSPLSFPSLAICTNAARSSSHVIDIHMKRTGIAMPQLQAAVFTAGIVLLLNIWGGKRSGVNADPKKEMEEVHRCLAVLKFGEKRDVICELASVGEFPLPEPSPGPSNKRIRGAEDSPATASTSSSVATPPLLPDGRRVISGNRRITQAASPASASSPDDSIFPLPMHSAELARLPLHGQPSLPSFTPSTDVGAINTPDDFWFSTMMNSAGAMQDQNAMPYLHNSLVPALNNPSPNPAQFPLDQVFYEQMGTGFPNYLAVPNDGQSVQPMAPQQPQHKIPQPQVVIQPPAVSDDTIAMWSNAPTGFE
ncbi:hypothetical protein HWV62_32437 [Athelia sp. TMB]|nr:hypothetical protein HWV62_32437 [Athelia sp. TMB]